MEKRFGKKFSGNRWSSLFGKKSGKEMIIQVELSRIIICEFNQHQVIYLKEKDGFREFPVVIGLFEATAINRRLQNQTTERPMTHDLFRNMVRALGGKFLDIIIYKVEGQTFYAHLRVQRGNTMILLDCRPSDAIVIALSESPPLKIFVQEDVLDKMAKP